MKKFSRFLAVGVGWLLLHGGSAHAQATFSNTGSITIPNSGIGTPYPSTISVSGLTPNILDVNVTLNGLSHTYGADIDVVLVGPTGAYVILLSDVIGTSGVTNVTYTFDQAAGAPLPQTGSPGSGTYQPANNGTPDDFPAPGPGNITQATPNLNSLNGTDPNGTWSLYVVDDVGGDLGSFAGGWSLTITVPCVSPPNAGTTTSTNTNVAPCEAFTLSLLGATGGFGQTYQWQISTDNITWNNIVGATADTYSTSQISNNYYRCIIDCSAQLDTSTALLINTATLTAGTTQADDATADLCQTFTLSLNGASAGPTISNQWQSSPDNITWSNIGGATNPTLATTQLVNTYYRCIVSCGVVADTSVVLQVTTNTFTAGTANASVITICPNAGFALSLTGNSTGANGYQWQSSPDNLTWTDIFGGNSATYNTSQTAASYYRCKVTCGAAADTSVEVFVALTSFFNCYCANSYAGSTIDEDIDTVRIGSFVNVSNTFCGSYTDYTNITPPVLFIGNNYSAGVSTRDCEGTFFYGRYVKVYIDLDHDGMYTEPNELMLSGPAAATNQSSVLGTIIIPPTALSGPTGMRVVCNETGTAGNVTPCGTYNWGETEDYLVILNPVPTNDAGTISLINPVQPSCTITDTIEVEITNIGLDTLFTADINYSINGGATTTTPWTGVLDSAQTTQVNLGFVNMNDGDVLKVWTSNPNGASDDFIYNDTLTVTIYEALNGSYTVYGTAPDFNTVNDAIAAMVERGICGDVFFNIRSGSYTEQFEFPTYPIAGTGNFHVTFQSEVLDASTVEFDVVPGTAATNYVARFNGGDNIILNELTLSATTFYARVIDFRGGSDNNTIRNCVLIGDTLAAADNFDKIVIVSTQDNDNNNSIINNDIWGGGRAISLSGISLTNPEIGAVIDSNTFHKFYFVGTAVFNQTNPTINHNTYSTTSLNTNVFRIYVQNVNNGIQVNGNRTYGAQGGFGINLDNASGTPGNVGLVSNNFIYMGDSTGTAFSEGIYLQNGTTLIDVVNNSVHVMNDNANSAAITIGAGTGGASSISLFNNNAVNSSLGKALIIVSNYNVIAASNNNFYTNNANVVNYMSANYATVPAYATASGLDMNSISVDPLFVADDLHTCRIELDNTASVYPGITVDFDGDTRNPSTPDIGADEFLTAQNFSIGPDTIKCPNDSIMLGAEIINSSNYYWSPYFQTTPTIYALNDGLYIVQVASACGTAVDSLVVTSYPLPVANFNTTASFYTVMTNNTSTNAVSYVWDFGDGSNTSTDVEPSHVFPGEGTYTITLMAISACGDTVTTTQVVNIFPQFFGMEEEQLVNLNVYPNPSEGYFTLSLDGTTGEDILVTIQDLSGRMIYERTYNSNEGEFVTPVDIRGTAAGTYILRLQSGKYSSVSKIIVR